MRILDILDKKWYGGLYHLHNTTDTWNQWLNEFEEKYAYPPEVVEKLSKIVVDNQSYIVNKNVIDLACNLGYVSLACSALGAASVLGVEARKEYIDSFYKVYPHWPKKNITMEVGDILDWKRLESSLKGIETIIYSGHWYHTDQQEKILEIFSNSDSSCIILESVNPFHDIIGHFDDVDNPLNGYGNKTEKFIPVRSFGLATTIKMLESKKWNIQKQSITTTCSPQRFTIVATKFEKHSVK